MIKIVEMIEMKKERKKEKRKRIDSRVEQDILMKFKI
jgi:hypothetical protein